MTLAKKYINLELKYKVNSKKYINLELKYKVNR